MDPVQAVILAIIQGLTEFLPVSSSGHLVLGHRFLAMEQADIFFDVILHFGTLIAVFIYFRKDIISIFGEIWLLATAGEKAKKKDGLEDSSSANRGLLLPIAVASIPTGLIGLFGKDFFESAFDSLTAVGIAFTITAFMVLSTYWTRKNAAGELNLKSALIIGIVQGLAIFPGISRSGSTIAAALGMGVKPESALRFSFLLSIPAILGALLLKLNDIDLNQIDPIATSLGLFVSALVGLLALHVLARTLRSGWFAGFSIWCIFMAMTAFLF